jgi:hypothetical protein
MITKRELAGFAIICGAAFALVIHATYVLLGWGAGTYYYPWWDEFWVGFYVILIVFVSYSLDKPLNLSYDEMRAHG